jgi:hypothetical protein
MTFLTKLPDGRIAEYRRHPRDPVVLHIQARVLKPDGTPYDDQWYPINDAELLRLNRFEPELLDRLATAGDVVRADGIVAFHHLDGDPTNNDLGNLRLVHVRENRRRP